ncbi:MAG: fructosamine kinase family protein [Bacteroidota bacterium]
MHKSLKEHIQNLLNTPITNVRSISGGDISLAYVLETESQTLFCKVNSHNNAQTMFSTEQEGLVSIARTQSIATPQIVLCDSLAEDAFLIMEYIGPKRATEKDMALLGHQLATLHLSEVHTPSYGWPRDNFIGSLPQSNTQHHSWCEFYVGERLLPQLKMARDGDTLSNGDIPSEAQLLQRCSKLFPETKPALLHGDLWSGNYVIDSKGTPYLIDPAIYMGHHEVDLAMTRLFGGFSDTFYGAYSEHFPSIPYQRERIEIYQLYYLLVHLNLFGSSYYGSVLSLLKRYFQ